MLEAVVQVYRMYNVSIYKTGDANYNYNYKKINGIILNGVNAY
jgi:hypothetical protein